MSGWMSSLQVGRKVVVQGKVGMDGMGIKRVSIISPEPDILVGGSYHDIMPVFGPLLVGSILKQNGYEVRIFEERLWPMDWDYILNSDAVGFYIMTCTVRRVMEHSRRIRTHNPQLPLIGGSTHASELPAVGHIRLP